MKDEIKVRRKQNSVVPLVIIVLVCSILFGNLFYNYYFQYGNLNNNQPLLSYSPNVISLSNSLFQHMLPLKAEASMSNMSNIPVGQNITTKEISNFAGLFNDQPFQGGQVSPRVAKWVNNDVFIFLQFDERTPSNATAINYMGIGKRGTFCEEDRPGPDFVHFHKWNATEYKHGHGSKAGDEGYWLMWIATGNFDIQGRDVKPGVDREFFPTPPPPKCGADNTN